MNSKSGSKPVPRPLLLVFSLAFILLMLLFFKTSSAELDENPSWESSLDDESYCVAWGDFDNDGDLDLAAGNNGPNHIYENQNGTLDQDPVWESQDTEDTKVTHEVMWGDIDENGWLDLVAVNGAWGAGYDVVYLNFWGVVSTTANWTNDNSDHSAGMDLGDYDGDGDLDLVTANYNGRECIYENVDGTFTTNPVWESYLNDDGTQDAVFLDVDGDDDLDLYFGCSATMDSTDSNADVMYFNEPGLWGSRRYGIFPDWQANNELWTTTVKAGDIDGDDDPDIIAANGYNNNNIVVMYENTGSTLDRDYSWNIEVNWPYSCDLGDVDQDGWLDVAITSYNEKVYLVRNEDGTLEGDFSWESTDVRKSYRCAWGDIDNDTFPELAVANYNTTSTPGNNVVYTNRIESPTVVIDYPLEGQELSGIIHITGRANGTSAHEVGRVMVTWNESYVWFESEGTDGWFFHWDTTEVENGEYRISVRAEAGPLESKVDVVNVNVNNPVNRPPSIEFTSPDAEGGQADDRFVIQWEALDEDDDELTIDLHYDNDTIVDNGREFIAIVVPDTGSYEWDSSDVDEGEYYICGEVDDNNGSTVVEYSEGTVEVVHDGSVNHDPVIEIISFDQILDRVVMIKWTATDEDDDDLLIDLYYDGDSTMGGEVRITEGIENSGEYQWDTSLLDPGEYYILAIASDGNGGEGMVYSETPIVITVESAPDLVLVDLEVLVPEIHEGDSVAFRVMVRNNGSSDAQVEVKIFWNGLLVDTKELSIRAGKEEAVIMVWNALEGNHTISVRVVADDDHDPTNNELSKAIFVLGTEPEKKGEKDEAPIVYIAAMLIVVVTIAGLALAVGRGKKEVAFLCPACGSETRFYREYNDYYCHECEEYVGDLPIDRPIGDR